MFSVGDQVEVIRKLDGAGQLLQNVYAEALAAEFGVGLWLTNQTVEKTWEEGKKVVKYLSENWSDPELWPNRQWDEEPQWMGE